MNNQIDTTKLPKHIAIIMDGNGRWAIKRGMNRHQGHIEGVNTIRKIVEAARKIGIQYLTIYAFSIENWNRPTKEVTALMNLVVKTIQREINNLIKNQVRLYIIGNINHLSQKIRYILNDCIEKTTQNRGLGLLLAISYSSRWEITEATRTIANKIKNRQLTIDEIDEKLFSDHLNTHFVPDPDLLIRTGGEYRISNYLLWQLAYAELYFTPIPWPEFEEKNLYEAIIVFQKRERRFGKIIELDKNSLNTNT